jgi:hypothetical protein
MSLEELNFTCPVCQKEIKDEEADNVTFIESELQFYHINCLNKLEEEKK